MESMNQDDNTLVHISHLHDLHLTERDATDVPPPLCHACGLACTGSSIYQCAPCEYVLHPSCARMGKTMRHPAHPEHPLSLLLAPRYESGLSVCGACGVGGDSFSFHCDRCQFDLHLPCAALPAAAAVPAHPHPLKLTCEDPSEGKILVAVCSACGKGLSIAQWFYWCAECDFAAHAGCAVPGAPATQLYPRIDVGKVREEEAARENKAREEEAATTAALLQQYQQMSALISAQSGAYARNTASILSGMQSMAVRSSDHNLEINFNKPGTEQENRKREAFYAQRRSYSK